LGGKGGDIRGFRRERKREFNIRLGWGARTSMTQRGVYVGHRMEKRVKGGRGLNRKTRL